MTQKGPGPQGIAQTYSKTPGTTGICDDLDVSFNYKEQNKKEKKTKVEESFRKSIESIDRVLQYLEKPNKSKSEMILVTSTMEQYFKIPEKSDEGRDDAIQEVSRQLLVVLPKIKTKLSSCFTIEIHEVGWFEKYSLWVRENIWGNIDSGSDLMAQAVGEDKMIFYPASFTTSITDTIIHEAAHLVGIGNEGKDYYFGESSWEKIKNYKDALEHPDAYANFVVQLSSLIKGRDRSKAVKK